jgi:hypothetical protein
MVFEFEGIFFTLLTPKSRDLLDVFLNLRSIDILNDHISFGAQIPLSTPESTHFLDVLIWTRRLVSPINTIS